MNIVATILVPLAFALMWAVEERWPARPYVPVRGWRRLGALFFVIVAITGTLTPMMWARVGLTSRSLLDLNAIGSWGLPLGLVAVSGVTYGWHRAVHHFDFLWRTTHQLHHSALRVDVPGAFFTHPFEVVAKSTLSLLVTTVLLGLAPPVAAMVSSLLAVVSIFIHWNVKTPRWLGWFIPRPEMHGLHHAFGVHGRNWRLADLGHRVRNVRKPRCVHGPCRIRGEGFREADRHAPHARCHEVTDTIRGRARRRVVVDRPHTRRVLPTKTPWERKVHDPRTRGPMKKILIVEDERPVREILARILGLNPHYEIALAMDGVEGDPPDLIITDVTMPNLDGLRMAHAVRQVLHKKVPIIVLTAKEHALDVVAGIQAGARHYLFKPVDVDDLEAKVKRLLGC